MNAYLDNTKKGYGLDLQNLEAKKEQTAAEKRAAMRKGNTNYVAKMKEHIE